MRSLVRRFATDPHITAIIGHRLAEVAVPASIAYNESQLVYIAPTATARRLDESDFRFVFFMSPGDNVMMKNIAALCKYCDFKKIVLLHGRDHFSMQRAGLFLAQATQAGLRIVVNRHFFEETEFFYDAILNFKNMEYDAIFIAAPAKLSGRLIRQIRRASIDKPILGTDTVGTSDFFQALGCKDGATNDDECSVKNVIAPAPYAAGKTQNKTEFEERFTEAYDIKPDRYAALGYDALMILSDSIKRADSTVPVLITTVLLHRRFSSVTGIQGFDEFGNAQRAGYFFKKFLDGGESQFIRLTDRNGKESVCKF